MKPDLVSDSTVRAATYDELRERVAELEAQVRRQALDRERLTALVDSLPEDIFFIDADGRVVLVNEAVRASLGVADPGDLHATVVELQSRFEVLEPDGSPRSPDASPALRALKGEEVRGEELVRHLATGELRHREYQVVPVRVGGRVVGAVSSVRDVTERKRAEEEARFRGGELAAMLDAQRDVVIEYDERMTVRKANGTFRADYGFDPEGLHVTEVMRRVSCRSLDGSPLTLASQPTPRALRGESVEGQALLVTRADGRDAVVETSANPLLANGRVVGSVTVWHDITRRVQAERELRHSEARYRELFDTMTEGFALHEVVCDQHGEPVDYRFLDINPAFERLTGLGRDIVGRTHNAVLPDDDPAWVRIYGKVALTGESIHFDNYSPALRRHYEVVAFCPARGRFATLFMDVTGRKATEERLQASLREAEAGRRTLEALMEYVPDGITIAEAPGVTIRRVSRYGVELLGAKHSDLTAAEVAERWRVYLADGATPMPPDDLPLSRAVKRGEVVTDLEVVQENDRGDRLVLLCNAAPIRGPDGVVTGGVVAWRNITEIRKAQDALRAREAALVEADRRKNEFLAVLSHELRNPLAPIKNSLYVLGRVAPDGDQARRAREIIERQTDHLSRLVDDLLDVTRITRNKIVLKLEDLELSELVRRVVEDQRSVFDQARVALGVHLADAPIMVHGDATRLAQVVSNLLQNAAKFTEAGGTAALHLECDAAVGVASITVRDTGIGMKPETLEQIFEPFVQAERSLDRGRGGLGLGLALVKRIVELHGGDVRARSDGLGRGSELVVRLPLHAEPSGTSTAEPRARRLGGCRVLVIEDNADAAESLRDALELGGHTVDVAHDGPQGIHEARALKPDVILCDIGLPGASGFEVARAVRADAALRSVLLVALSGYALPEDLARAREAGFDAHVAKPPSIEQLEELLARARPRPG